MLASNALPYAYADSAVDSLDEIVISAARRASSSEDFSASISLIDKDDVISQKLVTDSMSSALGVSLQQTTPGQGAAIIRGLKGSAILHLVDGMPLSNAMFRSAPTPYLSYVPTTAVERIEVVRGTPASLYGSQAVGGVIQVISYVPHFDSTEVQFRRDVSFYLDTAEDLQSVKGILDFGNQHVAASISAEYLSTGDRRIGGGQKVSPSGFDAKAARFVVNATPAENRSWLVDLHIHEQPGTPRVDELVAGFGQIDPSSSEFLFAPSRRVFTHVRHDAKEAWLGLNWRVDAAWQRIDDDRITRDFQASDRRRESNRSDLFAVSINAAADNETLSWVTGLDLQTDEVRSSRTQEDIVTSTAVAIAARFPSGSHIDQLAAFVNASWKFTDRQQLSGGLRVSDVRVDVPNTSVTEAAKIDVRRLSGDIGWIADFAESWQLVANVGFGFRAPNISDLGTLGNRPGNRFNIPNTNLGAESVRQFDIGVRRHTGNHRFELMLYTLQFDDRITSVLTGDATPDGRDIVQSVNTSKSSIRGAEAGASFNVSDKVSASAVLNYTWGREENGVDPAQAADRIPPLSAHLEIEFAVNDKWTAEAWLTVAREQDRLSQRDIRDVRINPLGTAGWTILGSSISWNLNDIWQVDLAADNLLDKRYREHGSGIDAPGRNISLTARIAW